MFPATFFDAPKCPSWLWIKVGPGSGTQPNRLWKTAGHHSMKPIKQPNSGPLFLCMCTTVAHRTPIHNVHRFHSGTCIKSFKVCSPEPKKKCIFFLVNETIHTSPPEVWTHGSWQWNHPTATAYFGSWWTFQDPEDCHLACWQHLRC